MYVHAKYLQADWMPYMGKGLIEQVSLYRIVAWRVYIFIGPGISNIITSSFYWLQNNGTSEKLIHDQQSPTLWQERCYSSHVPKFNSLYTSPLIVETNTSFPANYLCTICKLSLVLVNSETNSLEELYRWKLDLISHLFYMNLFIQRPIYSIRPHFPSQLWQGFWCSSCLEPGTTCKFPTNSDSRCRSEAIFMSRSIRAAG